MPGFVIHIAIAKEYERKHKNEIKNTEEFIKNAKNIVNDKNNDLDMESRINIYTFQVTMEGLLNLYRDLKNKEESK